jgi:hypothetical protein
MGTIAFDYAIWESGRRVFVVTAFFAIRAFGDYLPLEF